MVIYANGDSFTHGSELASDMLPGFPGWSNRFPLDEVKVKENYTWMRDIMKENTALISLYMDECVRRAYPQKVANILNCEVLNNSEAGASMDRIARNTIIDLLDLKNKGTKDIVAIIGTTSIFRIDLPIKNNQWLSMQIGGHNDNLSEIPPSLIVHYVKDYSVIHAYSNYYKNLILIQDFCKVNDIKLILIETLFKDAEESNENNLLRQYAKTYDFSMSKIAHELGGNIFAPCGHFSEIVHNKLADEIVKIL